MPATERRKEPRVAVRLPLRLTLAGRTVETRIVDLSNCGIRFHTPEALPLMNRVQLSLELPDGPSGAAASPIAITGVVVRCVEVKGRIDLPFDTAIFFEEISPSSARSRLERFVSHHIRPA
jgi:hypothetical protein